MAKGNEAKQSGTFFQRTQKMKRQYTIADVVLLLILVCLAIHIIGSICANIVPFFVKDKPATAISVDTNAVNAEFVDIWDKNIQN